MLTLNDPDRFQELLYEWAEIFMHRSMHDLVQFTRNSGISMPQLSTLMHLEHGGGCGVSDIGVHLGVTNAAASQMIDRLVNQGLIERSEDPLDRRGKHIQITPLGRKLLKEAIEARRRWMERLSTQVTSEEQELISKALVVLTKAARALEPAVTAPHLRSVENHKEKAFVQPTQNTSGS
jgi:DNA-binding MarR family transcriptional regulator